ncbi:MAG: metallophosphoesterase [Candidatus Thermoplasmatota archaeon]|nr:metallophosphoesterase [Candidatus Thermoplasmatota archaeon]MBS3789449.1 metallophosphoesterase [Candidatus Thermoplasmatota archaeon]
MATKFLVISDIHGSKRSLNKINAAYHKYEPDFSVLCGDITHFGKKKIAVEILEKIPTDVIGVLGNCDPGQIEQAYGETGEEYIELKITEKDDVTFIGLSGSNYSEEKVQTFAERSEGIDVFVSHQPVYGILDENSKGKHIGSEKLLPIIKKNEPKLVLSGHVHEDKGIVEKKGTVYMNPGPAADDNLGLVKIEDEKINAKLI